MEVISQTFKNYFKPLMFLSCLFKLIIKISSSRLLAHAKIESEKSKEVCQQISPKKSWWSFGWFVILFLLLFRLDLDTFFSLIIESDLFGTRIF